MVWTPDHQPFRRRLQTTLDVALGGGARTGFASMVTVASIQKKIGGIRKGRRRDAPIPTRTAQLNCCRTVVGALQPRRHCSQDNRSAEHQRRKEQVAFNATAEERQAEFITG